MNKKKRETIATYDPTKNALMQPGIYPAHICGVRINEVNTKLGHAYIYSLDYIIADKVENMEQFLYVKGNDGYFVYDEEGKEVVQKDANGKPIKISCAFLKGRKLQYSQGIFCFTEERGSGANDRYSSLIEIAGVEPEIVEIQPGIKVKQLVKLEESDLLGKPALITVTYKPYVTRETRELPKEQQEVRYSPKVIDVRAWDSGEPIDIAELEDDLPF